MSVLKVAGIQDLSGNEQFTAKAWVNFNGTGTVAIRDSGNVSSITDNGTGDYTVNFTNAMPDINYGYSLSGGKGFTDNSFIINQKWNVAPTTGALRVFVTQAHTGLVTGVDSNYNQVVIFR